MTVSQCDTWGEAASLIKDPRQNIQGQDPQALPVCALYIGECQGQCQVACRGQQLAGASLTTARASKPGELRPGLLAIVLQNECESTTSPGKNNKDEQAKSKQHRDDQQLYNHSAQRKRRQDTRRREPTVFIATRDCWFFSLPFFRLGCQSDVMVFKATNRLNASKCQLSKGRKLRLRTGDSFREKPRKTTQTRGDFNQLIRHVFIFNNRSRGCHGD